MCLPTTFSYSSVLGGYLNTAKAFADSIQGGYGNTANGYLGTIGGGLYNYMDSAYATIGGGGVNTAIGYASVVGGGQYNFAKGTLSSVCGGNGNTAQAQYSTVVGGNLNTAYGSGSVVMGQLALAKHDYSAVLSFNAPAGSCTSQGKGTVNVCATGSFYVNEVDIPSAIDDNAAGISDNTAAISSNSNSIATNIADIDGNADAIAFNADSINANAAAIASNATALSTLVASVSSLSSDVGQNTASISSLATDTLDLSLQIAAQTVIDESHNATLDRLRSSVDLQNVWIDTLNASTAWLEANASFQLGLLQALQDENVVQSSDISTNAAGISSLWVESTNHSGRLDDLQGFVTTLDASLSALEALDIAILHGNATDLKEATLDLALQLAAQTVIDESHNSTLDNLQSVVALQNVWIDTLNASTAWLEANASFQLSRLNANENVDLLQRSDIMQNTVNISINADAIAANEESIAALFNGAVLTNARSTSWNAANISLLWNASSNHSGQLHDLVDMIGVLDASLSALEALDIAILHGNATDLKAATLELALQLAAQTVIDETHSAELDSLRYDISDNRVGIVNVLNVTDLLFRNASKQQVEIDSLGFAYNGLTRVVDGLHNVTDNIDQRVSFNAEHLQSHEESLATLGDSVVQLSSSVDELQVVQNASISQLAEELVALNRSCDDDINGLLDTVALQADQIATLSVENAVLRADLSDLNDTVSGLLAMMSALAEGATFAPNVDDCAPDVDSDCDDEGGVLSVPVLTAATAVVEETDSALLENVTVWVNTSTNGVKPVLTEFNFGVEIPSKGVSYHTASANWMSGASGFVSFSVARPSSLAPSYVHISAANADGVVVECAVSGGDTPFDDGSTIECPWLNFSSWIGQMSVEEILDAVDMHNNEGDGSVVLIAALMALDELSANATVVSDAVATLGTLFLEYLTDSSGTLSVNEDVAVLSMFVDMVTPETGVGVVDALEGAIAAIGNNLASSEVPAKTIDTFLHAIDDFAAFTSGVDAIATLDNSADSACQSSVAAGVSNTQYSGATYELDCSGASLDSPAVVIESDSVTLVGSLGSNTNGSASVSITSWNVTSANTTSLTNDTVFMSEIQGITITTEDGLPPPEAEDVDDGFQLAISVNTDADVDADAFRRRLSCKFWDEDGEYWSSRGVFLRGIDVSAASNNVAALDAAAICVSTHLTLFTVTDEGEAAKVVESKIQGVAERFEAMSEVDFLSDATTLNPFVPAAFLTVTAIFIVVVVVAKVKGRSAATTDARLVFVQFGALKRPSVIGAQEQMAMLKGWLSSGQVVWLMILQVFGANTFLALFFNWSHEKIVFTPADKAFILYSGIVSTFLAQAFYFDSTESNADGEVTVNSTAELTSIEIANGLFNIFLGAMFASVLLFPVQYFLPYMIANVNSFETSTAKPQSILAEQMKALGRRICKKSAATRSRERHQALLDRELDRAMAVLQIWTKQCSNTEDSADSRGTEQPYVVVPEDQLAHVAPSRTIFQRLRFLCVKVKLPSYGELHGNHKMEAPSNDVATTLAEVAVNHTASEGIRRCQVQVRKKQRRRRLLRLLEFDHWLANCKRERGILTAINAAFVGILVLFTLMVCLLLSAAFTEQQCYDWAIAVAKSVLMQTVVTQPIIGFLVLFTRLAFSAILLGVKTRVQARRKRRELALRSAALAARHAHLENELRLVDAAVAAALLHGQSVAAQKQQARLLKQRLIAVEQSKAEVAAEQKELDLQTVEDDSDLDDGFLRRFKKQVRREPALRKSVHEFAIRRPTLSSHGAGARVYDIGAAGTERPSASGTMRKPRGLEVMRLKRRGFSNKAPTKITMEAPTMVRLSKLRRVFSSKDLAVAKLQTVTHGHPDVDDTSNGQPKLDTPEGEVSHALNHDHDDQEREQHSHGNGGRRRRRRRQHQHEHEPEMEHEHAPEMEHDYGHDRQRHSHHHHHDHYGGVSGGGGDDDNNNHDHDHDHNTDLNTDHGDDHNRHRRHHHHHRRHHHRHKKTVPVQSHHSGGVGIMAKAEPGVHRRGHRTHRRHRRHRPGAHHDDDALHGERRTRSGYEMSQREGEPESQNSLNTMDEEVGAMTLEIHSRSDANDEGPTHVAHADKICETSSADAPAQQNSQDDESNANTATFPRRARRRVVKRRGKVRAPYRPKHVVQNREPDVAQKVTSGPKRSAVMPVQRPVVTHAANEDPAITEAVSRIALGPSRRRTVKAKRRIRRNMATHSPKSASAIRIHDPNLKFSFGTRNSAVTPETLVVHTSNLAADDGDFRLLDNAEMLDAASPVLLSAVTGAAESSAPESKPQ